MRGRGGGDQLTLWFEWLKTTRGLDVLEYRCAGHDVADCGSQRERAADSSTECIASCGVPPASEEVVRWGLGNQASRAEGRVDGLDARQVGVQGNVPTSELSECAALAPREAAVQLVYVLTLSRFVDDPVDPFALRRGLPDGFPLLVYVLVVLLLQNATLGKARSKT